MDPHTPAEEDGLLATATTAPSKTKDGEQKGRGGGGFVRRMSSRFFPSSKTRSSSRVASSMMMTAGHGEGFDPTHPSNYYRPDRVFQAHAGMSVSGKAAGTYQFVVGPKVWLMTIDNDGQVAVSGPKTASDVDVAIVVTATIKYDSEKTWVRMFSGKANAMKLMVLGKLKFDGDMKKAEALNPLFEPKTLEPALKALPPDQGAAEADLGGEVEGEDDDEYEIDPAMLADMDMGRKMVYFYWIVNSTAWGIFISLYTYYLDDVVTNDNETKSLALSSYSTVVYSVAIFFMAPILGALSDSLGRRIMILSGCILDGITFVAWGTVTNPYAWVWASLLMGFDGSGLAGYTVMVDCAVVMPATMIGGPSDWWINRFTYGAARPVEYDVSKPELSVELRCAFILLNIYSIIGLILGDFVGEIVYYSAGIYWGMASAGIVMFLGAVVLYYYLPETLLPSQRKEFQLALCLEALTDQFRSVDMFASSALLSALASSYLLMSMFMIATWNIVLYWLEDKFSFSELQVGYLLLGVYFVIPPLAVLFSSRAFPALGFESVFTICFGLSAIGSFAINQVPNDGWLYVAFFIQAGAWSCYLLVLGVATPLVGYEDAGRLQGAMYAMSTIGSLIGTYGSYKYYDATYDDDYAEPVWNTIGALTMVTCVLSYSMIYMEREHKLDSAS